MYKKISNTCYSTTKYTNSQFLNTIQYDKKLQKYHRNDTD